MCGRYHLRAEEREVQDIGELLRSRSPSLPEKAALSGEICPGMAAPVKSLSRSGDISYFLMHWGFSMDKRLIINARAESVPVKPLFSSSFSNRRCLIPASSYYEWGPEKGDPYTFCRSDGRLLFMAGLYRFEPDRVSYVIVTRPASDAFSAVHDRMPLILSPAQQVQWLTPGTDVSALLSGGETDLSMQPPSQKQQQLRFF